jgi:hypothetical protein
MSTNGHVAAGFGSALGRSCLAFNEYSEAWRDRRLIALIDGSDLDGPSTDNHMLSRIDDEDLVADNGQKLV